MAAVLLLFVIPRFNQPLDMIPADPEFAQKLQRLRDQADDPGKWNVVVFTVDHGTSLDVAMRGVMDDAERQGSTVMRLNRKNDANAEFSAGVLLTSGTAPQAMLDSLIHGESAEWNPAQIGTHSRDDLKRKFLASLDVPTRSDDVFGTMFVVGEDDQTVIERDMTKSNLVAAQPMGSAPARRNPRQLSQMPRDRHCRKVSATVRGSHRRELRAILAPTLSRSKAPEASPIAYRGSSGVPPLPSRPSPLRCRFWSSFVCGRRLIPKPLQPANHTEKRRFRRKLDDWPSEWIEPPVLFAATQSSDARNQAESSRVQALPVLRAWLRIRKGSGSAAVEPSIPRTGFLNSLRTFHAT